MDIASSVKVTLSVAEISTGGNAKRRQPFVLSSTNSVITACALVPPKPKLLRLAILLLPSATAQSLHFVGMINLY